MVKTGLAQRVLADCRRQVGQSDIWSGDAMRPSGEFAGARIDDLAAAKVGFFVTVITEPLLLGNAFVDYVMTMAEKDVRVVPLRVGEEVLSMSAEPRAIARVDPEAKSKPVCFFITGAEEIWAGSRGSRPQRLANLVGELQKCFSIRERIQNGDFAPGGAFLLLPPRLLDIQSPQLREDDLGERITIPENDSARELVGRTLLRAISKATKTAWPEEMSTEEYRTIFETTAEVPILTSGVLLDRIKKARQRAVPQKLTKEASGLIREAIEQISISDKKTYSRKRDLIESLEKMPLVDMKPVVAEKLRMRLSEFERDFDSDLRDELHSVNLVLEGNFPEYEVSFPASNAKVKISVTTPYSSVRVNSRPVSNPFPRAIVEEITSIRSGFEGGRDLTMTSEEAAKFLGSLMDSMAVGAQSEDILVDEALVVAVSVLSQQGYRSIDSTGRPVVERLKELVSDSRALDLLSKGGWHPHLGRSGGIVIDGKQYSLFSRRQ